MDRLIIRSTSKETLPTWLKPSLDTSIPLVDTLDLCFGGMQEDILTTLPPTLQHLSLRLESQEETLLFYDLMLQLREEDWLPRLKSLKITTKHLHTTSCNSIAERKMFASAIQGAQQAATDRDVEFVLYANA